MFTWVYCLQNQALLLNQMVTNSSIHPKRHTFVLFVVVEMKSKVFENSNIFVNQFYDKHVKG